MCGRLYFPMFLFRVKQLRADKDRIILTADKGVVLVIMERKDYIEKAQQLLQDPNTYQTIPTDPTTKLKNRLISKVKKIKLDTRMEDTTYRRMYPTGAVIPKFYGLPKVHKENIPLRPIVSSIGSVSYGVAKEIARIIKPLVGSTEHHVNNSKEFIEEMKKMKLEEGECITSYDVSVRKEKKQQPTTTNKPIRRSHIVYSLCTWNV